MNADLDFPTGFRRVRRVDVGFRTCIRRCRCWVLRRRRRPARRGSDRGRWVRAAVGWKRGRSEGNFKKKSANGGRAGVDASPREVSAAHRLEAGHRPGRHAALFFSRYRCDALERYSAGARRSDERASATAFLNAGAVTSSRRITGGRECTDRRPPPAVDSQTRAPPGSATRRHTSVRDVRAPAHRRREREAHRRGIEQGRDARRGGEGAPARGRRSRGGR